jgi:hypothetical protein
MLLRLAFLESERRSNILENRGFARVHVFRKRLPRMHRDGWAGRKASSSIAYAWFVWDARHQGSTTINRISWAAHHHHESNNSKYRAPAAAEASERNLFIGGKQNGEKRNVEKRETEK